VPGRYLIRYHRRGSRDRRLDDSMHRTLERSATWRSHGQGGCSLCLIVSGAVLLPAQPAVSALPDPDHASCVEQFNLAVGTPGEYQRVFHRDELGRAVSYFARLSEDECPF
jgi:hypothetical protein